MKIIKRFFKLVVKLILVVAIIVAGINLTVILTTNNDIVTIDEVEDLDIDCILVLGAGYINIDTPTESLRERLDTAIECYDASGVTVLLTGDSENPSEHDEVRVMLLYSLRNGIEEEDIVTDEYSLSTYDSIWRAINVYGYEKVLIVTQKYHLSRALYIAEQLGIEAYGIAADQNSTSTDVWGALREIPARVKDFFYSLTGVLPTYTD